MAVNPQTLKPHQLKLFNIIKDVKESTSLDFNEQMRNAVNSGTPSMPNMTKKDYDALMDGIKSKNKSPINNDPLFRSLTGVTHESLLQTWTFDPTYTTCNSFIGVCGVTMGASVFKSLEPAGGKPSPFSLGQFEIATVLAARGLSRAWVPVSSGARPQYGDIFRAAEYHMGVCLDFVGDTLNTIESGQGGRNLGYDRLMKKSHIWGSRAMLGWVDVETLLAEKTAAPSWLGGWWKVDEGGTVWFYYFDHDGSVYCQQREPASRLFAPSGLTAWAGGYSILRGKYQTVEVRWFDADPDETFQVSTSSEKAPGTTLRDASKDTFTGKGFGGKPIKGLRLGGPAQTGLTYAQSHPHGGSGDSTARRY